MTSLSRIIGQPAIAIDDATEHGRATSVLIEHGRVTMIELDSGRLLPAGLVRDFEGEALTYDGVLVEAPPAEGRPRPSKAIGLKALTEDGVDLGVIEDVEIDGDGTVRRVMLRGGDAVDGARVSVVGSYAAIITTEHASVEHVAQRTADERGAAASKLILPVD